MYHEWRLYQCLKRRRRGLFENSDPAFTCRMRATRTELNLVAQNLTRGPPDHEATCGSAVPSYRVHGHGSFVVENLQPR
jgi:hypothetical protein